MNKQIIKMAKDLCHARDCHIKNEPTECYHGCRAWIYAERAVNKGYSKASVGEWIDRYNGRYANPIFVCSVCDKGTLLTPHINELGQMEMVQALSQFCPHCGAKMNESEGADDE